jgi:hypothetical protein
VPHEGEHCLGLSDKYGSGDGGSDEEFESFDGFEGDNIGHNDGGDDDVDDKSGVINNNNSGDDGGVFVAGGGCERRGGGGRVVTVDAYERECMRPSLGVCGGGAGGLLLVRLAAND